MKVGLDKKSVSTSALFDDPENGRMVAIRFSCADGDDEMIEQGLKGCGCGGLHTAVLNVATLAVQHGHTAVLMDRFLQARFAAVVGYPVVPFGARSGDPRAGAWGRGTRRIAY